MKRNFLIASVVLLTSMALSASAPADFELPDPHPASLEAWSQVTAPSIGWGSTDHRYKLNEVPATSKTLNLYGWRGERVNAQALVMAPKGGTISFSVSDLRCGKATIAASAINRYFVRYIMSDSFRNIHGKEDHGNHMTASFDSVLVADRLSPQATLKAAPQTLRPLWIEINIPADATPGKYRGTLTATVDGTEMTLPLSLTVGKRQLPKPADWKFHLDLWQNPYAVARFFDVPLWSKEHFDLMRPLMEELANAGQKVITASIIQHPWNSQTEDPFESMIGKHKSIDGKWSYDYRVFDRWIEFMMSCGITKQIDCYTILPWHLTFEYFDEARNCTIQKRLEPGSKEYEEYLLPMLTDFAAHLKSKGWFDITCIAMDERPKNLLEPAYEISYKNAKHWRIEGAINYYGPEVSERMYDISFLYNQPLLEGEQLSNHLAKGNKITFYTCCVPEFPNTFTFSAPSESTFLGWHAAAAGYSGYLRWAYNSWVKNAWQDSRFRTWAAGDCAITYPGGSSIRFKRLVEGIQDYEKIAILRGELKGKKLERLESQLEKFTPTVIAEGFGFDQLVDESRTLLRSLE